MGSMPEGDAVRRTARRLDAALAGGTLVRADLRVPRFATVDLRGMQVLGTHVVGKHMLTRLADDRREWTLHHHLRMDGSWRTGPPGSPGRPCASDPGLVGDLVGAGGRGAGARHRRTADA